MIGQTLKAFDGFLRKCKVGDGLKVIVRLGSTLIR
jgi:hypothetical protein